MTKHTATIALVFMLAVVHAGERETLWSLPDSAEDETDGQVSISLKLRLHLSDGARLVGFLCLRRFMS